MAYSPDNVQLPSFAPGNGERDEDWHKQAVTAIASQAFRDDFIFGREAMDVNYKYYQNEDLGEQFSFLQEAEDGSPYPAKWMNLNKIKNKIDTVLGEIARRGYEIRVEAINEEAKARKLDLRNEMRVEMHLKPIAQELESQFGIPLTPADKEIPDTKEDLDAFIKDHKELSETIIEYSLRFMAKMYSWDYERIAAFRDILIAGRCFWRVDVVNGVPKPKRIDPRFMVFDRYATDDFLSDSTYFGEVEYMDVSQAAVMYDLDEEEITEAYADAQAIQNKMFDSAKDASFANLMNGSSINYFDDSGDKLRVLVFKAVFKDVKKNKFREVKDKFGALHIKREKDGERSKGKEITQYIDIWRRGTLVAGKFLKDWGEMENRPTSVDTFAETLPPYIACLPNYLDFKTISKVDQLRSLQDLKNIVWYNLQLEMAASGGKSFIYDISQAPDGWEPEDVIAYLKKARVGFIDTSQNPSTTFNQFGQVDLTASPVMKQYLDMNAMIDNEMNAISGINEARQGLVKGASQAVGVTQSALVQSSLSTETLSAEFAMACSKVFDLSARYIKLLWPDNKERFAPIIGDVGVNFLEADVDLDLNDYGVFIEELPTVVSDQAQYQSIITAALQSQMIDVVDALELMMEKNIREGLNKLRRLRSKKEREMQQAAQAQQQMQAQQAMAQEQIKSAAAKMAAEGALQRQSMSDKSDETQTLLKAKTDLAKVAMQNTAKASENKQK